MLDKKEAELLCAQEKFASKEHDEIQKLVAKYETALEIKKVELEKEMEQKRMSMGDELETKSRASELKEVDLRQLEEMILEKEHELDKQSSFLLEKEKDVTERLKSLQTKEENLCADHQARELEKIYIQEEKEQIKSMKVDLEKSLDILENKRKEVEEAQVKLDADKHEMNEVQVLEMRLKDELDSIRAQKLDLLTEAENLKAEKSKFEIEWELIDEKRDELRNKAERISEERKVVSKFLKDERDRLKVEKDALEEKFKNDLESLSREREDFTNKDLLKLEKETASTSSLESTLLVCKKDLLSKTPKATTSSEKLVTSAVPKSQFLGKVKDFLGVMAEANARLQHDAKETSCMDYNIEELTGNESEYIEMDLVLGVADLHTPEAVAAAEAAMAGSQPVIPLAADCSGSDSEGSDDDDNNNAVDANAHFKACSSNKFGNTTSDKDVGSNNSQGKKRKKIVELP